jgi:hypothetical protein
MWFAEIKGCLLMEDHEVLSKVTGGCSLPQLWVGELGTTSEG